MKIEEFLVNLKIACSPERQLETNNKESCAHLAMRMILEDKDTVFIIINILQNTENFTEDIIFLTLSIFRLLVKKINFDIYSFETLDQFSLAFLHFITKFIEHGSIFSQAIVSIAKIANFNYKFILPLEQLAFEELCKYDNRTYEFAINTIIYLIQFYQYHVSDKNIQKDFYNRIQDSCIPTFSPDFENYHISSKVIAIYKTLDLYSFDLFYQDHKILDIFLFLLQNLENMHINDSTLKYIKNIMKFLTFLIDNCRNKLDNKEGRRNIYNEYILKILQILPQICFYLSKISLQSNFTVNYLKGQSLFFIINNFASFRKMDLYDSYFDILLNIIGSFSQLCEDDIYDFDNNILNFYNTAFVIEKNCNSNARSNSVILLDLMCKDQNTKYINHAMEVFLQIQPKEEIFFLLSNITQYVSNDQVKEAVHQYISNLLNSFQSFPLYIQFTFIFFAARFIFVLSKEEAEKLLQVASLYIGEAKKDQETPVSCFFFTIASEIIYNFIQQYNCLPNEVIEPFIQIHSLSYSVNAVQAVDLIFEKYPKKFEIYQNYVIAESLKSIEEIISNETEFSLSINDSDVVETNFKSLINQASHPNLNFPTNQICDFCDRLSLLDDFQVFIPQISNLYLQIIQVKANDYGVAAQSAINLFSNSMFFYYDEDIVKPILSYISENLIEFLNSGVQQSLLETTIKNINNQIDSSLAHDDQSLKDINACTTLLSRLIQALRDSITPEMISSIYQLIMNLKKFRNDLASHFIIYEILASLTLVGKGQNMQDFIDDWIKLCSTGVIQHDYYRQLHFIALKIISETFPNRSIELLAILNGLESDTLESDDFDTNYFENHFTFLYDYESFKAPFQFLLADQFV